MRPRGDMPYIVDGTGMAEDVCILTTILLCPIGAYRADHSPRCCSRWRLQPQSPIMVVLCPRRQSRTGRRRNTTATPKFARDINRVSRQPPWPTSSASPNNACHKSYADNANNGWHGGFLSHPNRFFLHRQLTCDVALTGCHRDTFGDLIGSNHGKMR